MQFPIAIIEALAAAHRADLLDAAARHHPPRRRRRRLSRLQVRVRPIRRTDAARFVDAFNALSPQSRQARFLTPKHELTKSELRYFTDVDHNDHEALIAVTRWRRQALGVARFVRNGDDPSTADVAVTVVDGVQGRGLGTLLVNRLAERARDDQITAFTALTTYGNIRARRLLAKVGEVRALGRDGATITYRADLCRPVGHS